MTSAARPVSRITIFGRRFALVDVLVAQAGTCCTRYSASSSAR
jgi:hypothetical protein